MISGCIGTSALSCTPKPKTIPFQFRVKIGTHVESLKCVSIDAKACSHPSIHDPVN
jgi:hypothetical protein